MMLGIRCPQCGCSHLYVLYTRRRANRIVRRKACRNCGYRLMTVEKDIAVVPPVEPTTTKPKA